MKKISALMHKLGTEAAVEQMGSGLSRTCVGRIASATNFIVIILCLALWIFAFLSLIDSSAKALMPQNIFSGITCLTFFGGLVLAIFIGAVVGNFLRREFWKWLSRRKW